MKKKKQIKRLAWREYLPLAVTATMWGVILLAILYLVIAFGIFGTVMMMSMERRREFGVMVAVGMQKRKLTLLVILETCMIGFLGLLISFVAGIALLVWALLFAA